MVRRSLVALLYAGWLLSSCHWALPYEAGSKSGSPDTGIADLLGQEGPLLDLMPEMPRHDLRHPDTTPQDMLAPDGPQPPGNWVVVPAGSFTMGSPTGEGCRADDDTQHPVTLTHPFAIQTTEVTQEQYAPMMGDNPSQNNICPGNCPVDAVSWHMAAAYCNALSVNEGLAQCYACNGTGKSSDCSVSPIYAGSQIYACPGYRLPTEAEWEYAYRAGTSTAYYNGDNDGAACQCSPLDVNADAIAWYCAHPGISQPVAQKQPNAWGLFDMAGNVWEWCHDHRWKYGGTGAVTDPVGNDSGTHRIVRGGSWAGEASYLRAAHRLALEPHMGGGTNGFRCVRSL
ncbi:MAG: formylglycine-generating enzyme family protein [Planctomycetota bacterium]|jgi:formylglycine-generating enzyme required for sulfatase activity